MNYLSIIIAFCLVVFTAQVSGNVYDGELIRILSRAENDPQDFEYRSLNTYENAEEFVNGLKKNYGYGVSTKVIIYNKLSQNLLWRKYRSYSGKFYSEPPYKIPPGTYAGFLHAKKDAAATGSIGFVSFEVEGVGDQAYLGWYTPYSGRNYVGGKVAKPNETPDGLHEMTSQTRTNIETKKVEGISIKVYSELKYDGSSTLVYYTIEDENR